MCTGDFSNYAQQKEKTKPFKDWIYIPPPPKTIWGALHILSAETSQLKIHTRHVLSSFALDAVAVKWISALKQRNGICVKVLYQNTEAYISPTNFLHIFVFKSPCRQSCNPPSEQPSPPPKPHTLRPCWTERKGGSSLSNYLYKALTLIRHCVVFFDLVPLVALVALKWVPPQKLQALPQ